jgi:pyrophosphatase PpaX
LKFDNIRHLLFDFDGTLIDSSRGVIISTNYALKALGEPPRTDDEIKHFIGYPLEEMFHRFSDKPYSEFWKHFQEIGLSAIAASAEPVGESDHVLDTLYKRGYVIGIGTTKMRVHVSKILEKLHWNHLVSAFVGADDVAKVKPAPEAYQKLLQVLGGKIDDSVVIGDTVNDIQAARAAGLPAVAVSSPFGREDDLKAAGPDLFLYRLVELLDILK